MRMVLNLNRTLRKNHAKTVVVHGRGNLPRAEETGARALRRRDRHRRRRGWSRSRWCEIQDIRGPPRRVCHTRSYANLGRQALAGEGARTIPTLAANTSGWVGSKVLLGVVPGCNAITAVALQYAPAEVTGMRNNGCDRAEPRPFETQDHREHSGEPSAPEYVEHTK